MSDDHAELHSYEIHVEGGMSEMFKASFPGMRTAELAPCVVLVVEAPHDTDAADLALQVQALGHSVLSVRRCSDAGLGRAESTPDGRVSAATRPDA